MSEDKLDKVYIPHLAGQFGIATPVLFTGAGFSRDAKNIEGVAVPIADELCREIWAISFPGEEYEEGSLLRDLFEDARLRHAGKLKDRLTKLLTIDPQDLPEFYQAIYSMPWLRSYTLNIDNLEDAVSRAFALPRRPRPVSATTSPPLMLRAAAIHPSESRTDRSCSEWRQKISGGRRTQTARRRLKARGPFFFGTPTPSRVR